MRILLLQSTTPERAILQQQRFARACGISAKQIVGYDTITQPLTKDIVNGYDAVFIGGSLLYRVSHYQHERLEELCALVRSIVERNIPLLGVCYGAHVLAHAFGGTVEYVPKKRELGTYPIHILAPGREDALFAHMPETFFAQCGRTDDIIQLPLQAVPLANSERVQFHAFKIAGKPAHGIQFHPELNSEDMHSVLTVAHEHGSYFENEEEYQERLSYLKETPIAESVLPLFLKYIV